MSQCLAGVCPVEIYLIEVTSCFNKMFLSSYGTLDHRDTIFRRHSFMPNLAQASYSCALRCVAASSSSSLS
jgi:hypothetical protein